MSASDRSLHRLLVLLPFRSEMIVGIAALLVLVGVALVLVGPVGAEPIDPSTQPHMKSWSNVIPKANRRFVVLADLHHEAVLDRETGLVWEKAPDSIPELWASAARTCVNKNVGGRKGWRLPSIPELASLIDPTASTPALPVGHPFTNVQSSQEKGYWSATRVAADPHLVWHVFFVSGLVNGNADTVTDHVWCVRGPMSADQY